MSITTPSARRRRSLVGAGVAAAVCAGLVVGDGLVAVAPAEAAGQSSGLPAASIKSFKTAGKKLKNKGFSFFGTRGYDITDADVTNPTPGSFVHRQFVGDENEAPKSLASTEVLVGPAESIPASTRTYVAATQEEADGVAVKHKSAWTRVKKSWTSSIVSMFGRSITPEMQVDAAIATRRAPDSANAQKGKYRKRMAVAGVSLDVESTWSGDKLQSVEIVDQPQQHAVPADITISAVKGFWHGAKGPVAKKADLKDQTGPLNSARAAMDSGKFLIEGKDRSDPTRPASTTIVSVSPFLQATTGNVFYGKRRPADTKYELAVVEKATRPDGSRLVEVWAPLSGVWVNHGEQVLPPKGWAAQHLVAAQKRLMANGTPSPETAEKMKLPGDWEVVRGSYKGVELGMLVATTGNGKRTPQFTWVWN